MSTRPLNKSIIVCILCSITLPVFCTPDIGLSFWFRQPAFNLNDYLGFTAPTEAVKPASASGGIPTEGHQTTETENNVILNMENHTCTALILSSAAQGAVPLNRLINNIPAPCTIYLQAATYIIQQAIHLKEGHQLLGIATRKPTGFYPEVCLSRKIHPHPFPECGETGLIGSRL